MSCENGNSTEIHKVFTNDPVLFQSYLNKSVKITTKDRNFHEGVVYTVDPVSESVILVEEKDGQWNGKVVIGHSIDKIEITPNSGKLLPDLFPPLKLELTESELIDRKNHIIRLLSENCLPVIDNNGVIEIEGMVSIEPPYSKDNCVCNNPIILKRIHNILANIFT